MTAVLLCVSRIVIAVLESEDERMRSLLAGAAAVLVGVIAASVTVVSLISGETGAPANSPGDASQSQLVEYGTVEG